MRYDPRTKLMMDSDRGMAWQVDPQPFEYGEAYVDRYRDLEATNIGEALNALRVAHLLCRGIKSCIDVGIGSGAFLKECWSHEITCYGYDVNPVAIEWLNAREAYLDPYEPSDVATEAITCWDSIEHMKRPGDLLDRMRPGCYLLATLPIFHRLSDIASSKHYKPNEHLWYWTAAGFVGFLASHDLHVIEMTDSEVRCGREQVATFIARKAGARS